MKSDLREINSQNIVSPKEPEMNVDLKLEMFDSLGSLMMSDSISKPQNPHENHHNSRC